MDVQKKVKLMVPFKGLTSYLSSKVFLIKGLLSIEKSFVLSLTAQFCWNVYPMDVKSTLLNGELEEEVYMVHPKDLKSMGGNT